MIAGTSEGFLADQVNDHIKENGESIFGIALEVENIEEVFQSKEYSNFQNIKITSGEGINLDSGAKREWKNIMLPKESTRGVFTLLIEHTSGFFRNTNLLKTIKLSVSIILLSTPMIQMD